MYIVYWNYRNYIYIICLHTHTHTHTHMYHPYVYGTDQPFNAEGWRLHWRYGNPRGRRLGQLYVLSLSPVRSANQSKRFYCSSRSQECFTSDLAPRDSELPGEVSPRVRKILLVVKNVLLATWRRAIASCRAR